MKIDMLMLLYLRFVDFPIVLICSKVVGILKRRC